MAVFPCNLPDNGQPLEYPVRPAEFRLWFGEAVWLVGGLGLVGLIESLHTAGMLRAVSSLY